jgi:hypothetical protein
MDTFSVLGIITDTSRVRVPTHCGGFNDAPPVLSGASKSECNSPTGCNKENSAFGTTHHKCSLERIIYCECSNNPDKEEGTRVTHYFRKPSKDLNEYNHCYKCQKECGQE